MTRVHLQNVSPTVAALAIVVSPSASTRVDRYPWVYFRVLLSSEIYFQNQLKIRKAKCKAPTVQDLSIVMSDKAEG